MDQLRQAIEKQNLIQIENLLKSIDLNKKLIEIGCVHIKILYLEGFFKIIKFLESMIENDINLECKFDPF